MTRTVVERSIDAPIDLVFSTVSDIRNFSKALPHVVECKSSQPLILRARRELRSKSEQFTAGLGGNGAHSRLPFWPPGVPGRGGRRW